MSQVAIYSALLALLCGVAVGWTANDWRRDSIELAADRGAQRAINEHLAREASIAAEAERRISALKTVEKTTRQIIERQAIKNEIVYRSDCIDDAGRLQYNRFAVASDPAKPID